MRGLAIGESLRSEARVNIDVAAIDHARILRSANRYLKERPITITAYSCPHNAGGLHDCYSDADYWWRDPKNPNGPYIHHDGMSNPDNFTAHRQALMRLSIQAAALAAAWHITDDERYAAHAAQHLRAWFLNKATLMNPNLQYSQPIHGVATGRSIGVVDTLLLVEVARSITALSGPQELSTSQRNGIEKWHW